MEGDKDQGGLGELAYVWTKMTGDDDEKEAPGVGRQQLIRD